MGIDDLNFVDGIAKLEIGNKEVFIECLSPWDLEYCGDYQISVWENGTCCSTSAYFTADETMQALVGIGLQGADI